MCLHTPEEIRQVSQVLGIVTCSTLAFIIAIIWLGYDKHAKRKGWE
jgi:hypothetical protein